MLLGEEVRDLQARFRATPWIRQSLAEWGTRTLGVWPRRHRECWWYGQGEVMEKKNTSNTIKMIIPRYLVNTGEVINAVRTVWPGYLSLASAFFHVWVHYRRWASQLHSLLSLVPRRFKTQRDYRGSVPKSQPAALAHAGLWSLLPSVSVGGR